MRALCETSTSFLCSRSLCARFERIPTALTLLLSIKLRKCSALEVHEVARLLVILDDAVRVPGVFVPVRKSQIASGVARIFQQHE